MLNNPPSSSTGTIFSFKSVQSISDPTDPDDRFVVYTSLTYNNLVTLNGSGDTITLSNIGVYMIHFKLQATSVEYAAGASIIVGIIGSGKTFALNYGTEGFTTFFATTQANSTIQFSGSYTGIYKSAHSSYLIIQQLN
jgi:hypothetical protein